MTNKGVVEERIVKVSMDISDLNKKGSEAKNSLKNLFDGLTKGFNNIKTDGAKQAMTGFTNAVKSGVEKSNNLLSNLRSTFSKALGKIDVSKPVESIKTMNTRLADSVNKSSTVLGRLRSVFSKTSINGEGFNEAGSSAQKMTSVIQNALGSLMGGIGKVNARPISDSFASAASSVQSSISVMDIALGTLVGNLSTKALGVVTNFAKQFTHGMRDGYGEYENKMGSIQTILTNTQWDGSTLGDVKKSLADLNDYADQTIYSFEDMTRNIGTFTAAGVRLDDAQVAIKGIANLAAASGSNTQQASTAMYQLSQALAAGKVGLQDWNSVVNAGMGGKLFQDALIKTGERLGSAKDASKSFRESLRDGWLTTEVLLQTLSEFSTNEAMLEAATKVKSFSQLVDTTKEAIGSGWAETWEYVFGDFEQAKSNWTDIGNVISAAVKTTADARNNLVKAWSEGGGFDALWSGIKNIINGVFNLFKSVGKSFGQAFKEVFGQTKSGAQILIDITKGFENLTKAIMPGANGFKTLTNILKVVFTVIKTGINLFKVLSTTIGGALKIAFTIAGAAVKIFLTALNFILDIVYKVLSPIEKLSKAISDKLSSGIKVLANWIDKNLKSALTTAATLFQKIADIAIKLLSPAIEFIVKLFKSVSISISDFGKSSLDKLKPLTSFFKDMIKMVSDLAKGWTKSINKMEVDKVVKNLKPLADIIGKTLVGAFKILSVLIAGPVVLAFKALDKSLSPVKRLFSDIAKAVKPAIDKFKSVLKIGDIFGDIGKSLSKFGKTFNSEIDKMFKTKKIDFSGIKDAFITLGNDIKRIFGELGDRVKEAWSKMLEIKEIKKIAESFDNLKESFAKTFGPIITKISDFVKDFKEKLADLPDSVTKIFNDISKIFTGFKPQKKAVEGFDIANAELQKMGFELSGFSKIMDNFKKNFNFKEVGAKFTNLKKSFDETFGKLGNIKAEDYKIVFTNIGSYALTLGDNIKNGLLGVLNGFTNGNFGKNLDVIKSGIGRVFESLKNVKFSDFNFSKLFSAGFRGIGSIFAGITNQVRQWASGLGDGTISKTISDNLGKMIAGFSKLSTGASKIFEDVGVLKSVENFGLAIKNAFVSSFTKIKEAFGIFKTNDLTTNISAFIDKITGLINNLSKGNIRGISDSFTILDNVVRNLSLSKVFAAITATGFVAFAVSLWRVIHNFGGLLGTIDGFVDSIKDMAKAMNKGPKAMDAFTGAFKMMKIALAIGSVLAVAFAVRKIAEAFKILGEMKPEQMKQGAKALTIVMAELAVMTGILNFIKVDLGTIAAILTLATTLKRIAKAILMLGEMDAATLKQGQASISLILGAMALATRLMNVGTGGSIGNAATVIALALAVRTIGKAVEQIGQLDEQKLSQGRTTVSILIGVLGLSVRLMNMGGVGSFANAATILSMAQSVKMIGKSIEQLGGLDQGQLRQGQMAVTVIMGVMALCVKLMQYGKTSSFTVDVTLLTLAKAVGELGKAVEQLGKLDIATLTKGTTVVTVLMGFISSAIKMINSSAQFSNWSNIFLVISFAGAVGALAAAVVLLGQVDLKSLTKGTAVVVALLAFLKYAATLGQMGGINAAKIMSTAASIMALGLAVNLLIPPILIFSAMDLESLAKGVGTVAVALVSLGGSVGLMNKLGGGASGALSLITMAGALLVLSQAMVMLGALDIETIGRGLFAFGGAMLILVGAAALTGIPLVGTGLIILAAAIASLGVALIGFGVAAAGMAMLINSIVSAFNLLSNASGESIRNVINNLLLLMTEISAKAVLIGYKAMEIVTKFVAGIIMGLPQLIQMGVRFITTILEGLAQAIPQILPAATQVIVTFIQGLTQSVSQIVPAVVELIATFITTLLDSLAKEIPRVAESFRNFIKTVVDQVKPFFEEVVIPLGQAIMEGIGKVLEGGGALLTGFGNLASGIGSILQGLAAVISATLYGISAVFSSVFSGIEGIISASLSGIEGIITASFSGWKSLISTSLSGFEGIIKTTFEGIETTLKAAESTIKTVGESVKVAFEGMGSGVKLALEGVSGVIDSFGNSAEKAGKGFDSFANGIVKITNTRLGDLTASLTAVVTAVGNLAAKSGDMEVTSTKFKSISDNMMKLTTIAPSLSTALSSISTASTTLNTSLSGIPEKVTALGTAFMTLGPSITGIVTSFTTMTMPMTMVNMQFTMMMGTLTMAAGQFTMLGGALMMVTGGFTAFNAVLTGVGVGMTAVSTGLTSINTSLMSLTGSMAALIGGFTSLSASMVALGASMLGVNAQVLAFNAQFAMLTGVFAGVSGAVTLASGQFTMLAGAITMFNGTLTITSAGLTALNGVFSLLTAGMNVMKGALSGIQNGLTSVAGVVPSITSSFASMGTTVATTMASIRTSVSSTTSQVTSSMRSMVSGMVSTINSGAGQIRAAFNNLASTIRSSMVTATNSTRTNMTQMANTIKNNMNQMVNAGRSGGQRFSNAITSSIQNGIGRAKSAASSMVQSVAAIVRSGQGSMVYAGSMLAQGVARGIYGSLGAVRAAANSIIAEANRAARAAAVIRSPSRLFRDQVGKYLAQGVAVGMDKGTKYVTQSAINMIHATEEVANQSTGTLGDIIRDAMNIDDPEPYSPTIVPIVDSSNFDNFVNQNREIKIGATSSLPSTESMQKSNIVERPNVDNSHADTYNITIDMKTQQNVDPRDIAREIEREIKRNNDRGRRSRGG